MQSASLFLGPLVVNEYKTSFLKFGNDPKAG